MSRLLHRIFVYGTLKRGQPNYFRLQDESYGVAKFLGEAKLSKRYPLVVATKYYIPMLLSKEGTGKEVSGELYEVDAKMLEHLDWLEDHPNTYKRVPTQCVMLEDQTVADCEVYVVFNFRDQLLELPFLSCYDDTVVDKEKKYRSRVDRDDDAGSVLKREIKNKS